ncbi:MAG: methyltransferase domain-containing protein [Cyanobacteria bacterium P01_F01_bin.116]
MVSARSRFLGTGAYAPLADALVSLLGQPQRLADLGCGEGFFTAALCQSTPEVYGLDISKIAVRAACKQATGANFVVASTIRLPFVSKAFDAVTVIMAPMSPDVPRILKQKALLCRVSPGERHLVELRELAYQEVRPVKQPPINVDKLTHTGSEQVRFDTLLGTDRLMDLIAMTPMQFRTSKEFREQVSQIHQLTVTADFRIDLFRKD